MRSYKEWHRTASSSVDDHGQSMPLLWGAVVVALLAGSAAGGFGGLIALFGVLGLLFVIATVRDYRTGVVAVIALLPMTGTQIFPRELFGIIGLNPFNLALLVSLMSIGLRLLFRRDDFAIPALPRPFLLYAGLLCLSAVQGSTHVSSIPAFYEAEQIINFHNAVGYIRDTLIKPMLIVIVALMLSIAIRHARRPARYLLPMFLPPFVLAGFVVAYVAISGTPLSTLASGTARGFLSVTGMHANELGLMFNMSFAVALFTFPDLRTSVAKWSLGITIVILAAAVLVTFSRGAFLGMLGVAAYFLYSRQKFSVMLAGFFLLAASFFVLPQAILDRIATGIVGGGTTDVSAGRIDLIWAPLLPDVMASPLIGNGLNSILWSQAAQHGQILRVGHPHSAYLGVLLDFGILGALVVLMFFRHMWHLFAAIASTSHDPLWRGYFRGAMACIILLLVQGVTDDRFTPTLPQTFLWMSYGLALGLSTRSMTRSTSPRAYRRSQNKNFNTQ